jgi:hypothetical protein
MATRVFLSHAWVDQSPARTVENPRRGLVHLLRDALRQKGVECFYDDADIQDLDDIDERIERGLNDSTLMVGWYSDAYPTRRACQWELMSALTTDARRVIVVNPEPSLDHILPTSLRAHLIPAPPDEDDIEGWSALARLIVSRARAMDGVFGQLARPDATAWYGDPPARFNRFVGRAQAIWELDSLLRPASGASGGAAPAKEVVVHGLGGVGKTAFALEYAGRFAGAYAGGIFWLRAGGGEPQADSEPRLTGRLNEQLLDIASQLEPSFAEPNASDVTQGVDEARRVIRTKLESAKQPFLWVVDDLPAGLSTAAFRRWLPPSHNGRVVVTSQGATYRHVSNLPLPVMTREEAVELLRAAGSSHSALDTAVGDELANRLGYLPLALETVGTLASLPGTSPEMLLSELEDPVELAERAAANAFMSASPTEHPLDLATTFGPSLTRLDDASFGLLAAAAALKLDRYLR